MIRDFLEYYIKNGAWNFDVVVSKCLSVVLIASLDCRTGDVGQSKGYSGTEYMKYEDIELYLPADAGPKPSFDQLRATVKKAADPTDISQANNQPSLLSLISGSY